MESFEPLASLGIAVAVGLLIGFEREQSRPESPEAGVFVAGTRTYPLVALCGAVSMLLAAKLGVAVVLAAFVALAAFRFVSYLGDLRAERDPGLTSEVVFLLTFLLGALATAEVITPVGRRAMVLLAVAVAVTAALSIKMPLHALARNASRDDVIGTVKFLIVAVIVLPMLPDRTFGPYDVFNPFEAGVLVVLIAGMGFVGYVSVRALGAEHGLGLTGLIGGLASSTAVTLAVSRRVRSEPKIVEAGAMAIVAASSVMFLRVLIEVAFVHRPLLRQLAVPLGAMSGAAIIAAVLLWRRSRKDPSQGGALPVQNPFELGSSLKFGALFIAALFLSKVATDRWGVEGSYLAGVVAGLTDVDAITLSMAELARGGLDADVAATSIILALGSNTLVKAVMALVIGGRALGGRVLLAALGTLAAGGGALAVVSATG